MIPELVLDLGQVHQRATCPLTIARDTERIEGPVVELLGLGPVLVHAGENPQVVRSFGHSLDVPHRLLERTALLEQPGRGPVVLPHVCNVAEILDRRSQGRRVAELTPQHHGLLHECGSALQLTLPQCEDAGALETRGAQSGRCVRRTLESILQPPLTLAEERAELPEARHRACQPQLHLGVPPSGHPPKGGAQVVMLGCEYI